jgi:hypothetical protein
MRSRLTQKNQSESIAVDKTLKATALIYLNEALTKERYEDCREIIKRAKRFGAESQEIQEVISSYVRKLKAINEIKANSKTVGR